ncbi:MAG: helix-turn-helix domain-containing protein [Terriglobia bacterium]|jgi:excisionase family DNA binding protein
MNKKITLTMKAGSDVSGLSIRTLYNLIAKKRLQSVTVGRRRLIVAKSLEELLLGKTGG